MPVLSSILSSRLSKTQGRARTCGISLPTARGVQIYLTLYAQCQTDRRSRFSQTSKAGKQVIMYRQSSVRGDVVRGPGIEHSGYAANVRRTVIESSRFHADREISAT